MKHSTSTILRPPGARDSSGGTGRPSKQEPGDHTRLIQRRRNRQFFGIGAMFIIIAIVGALLVLPLRAWQDQRTELAARQREYAALSTANGRLAAENERLAQIAGIEEAARRDYAFRSKDETVIGMLPPGPVSAQLPAGWPYTMVDEILNTRSDLAVAEAEAAAAAAMAATAPAAVNPEPAPAIDPALAPADPATAPAVDPAAPVAVDPATAVVPAPAPQPTP
jgi:cell division protein FtsB